MGESQAHRGQRGAVQKKKKKVDDRSGLLVSYLALTLKGHPSLIDPSPLRDKRTVSPKAINVNERWMGRTTGE